MALKITAFALAGIFFVWQFFLIVRDIRDTVKRRKGKSLANDELKGE